MDLKEYSWGLLTVNEKILTFNREGCSITFLAGIIGFINYY